MKNSALSEITDRKTKITELHAENAKLETAITEHDTRIATLTQGKEKQMSSDFKILSEKADKLSKELVKVGSAVNNQEDTLQAEEKAAEKVSLSYNYFSPPS